MYLGDCSTKIYLMRVPPLLTDKTQHMWALIHLFLRFPGFNSLEELTDAAVPKHIRLAETVPLEPAKSES